MEGHRRNIDNFVWIFLYLFCFFFCCVNVWIIDFPLLVHWRFVDDSLYKLWRYSEDFDANIIDHKCFFNLISETMIVNCCFVDDSLMNIRRDIFEALLFSLEAFLIFIVFVVLTCDSFMFHCFFLKDSLMTLWRNIDETPKTWMQTLKIIEVLNVMIIRTLIPLLLHWLFVDDPMKIFDKILMIWMQTLVTKIYLC